MAQLLIFLLALYQLHSTTYSELLDTPRFSTPAENEDDLRTLFPPETQGLYSSEQHDNEIDEETYGPSTENITNDNMPLVKSGRDHTEMQFRHPIAGVNIDYARNLILLKFRKDRLKQHMKLDREEQEKRRSLENNFMRFGRSPNSQDFMRFGRSANLQDFMRFGRSPGSQDFMRFGKRQLEELPNVNSIDGGFYNREPNERYERSSEVMRDSRGDNFMRFGRSSADFMRFGRTPADFMRFGRSPEDFMRLGRSPADFMRFGRSADDFMRLGRSQADFMRFGRTPADFMRFGRSADDAKRLGNTGGETNDFMRFGRSPSDFLRFGRSSKKMSPEMDRNFMRFGRSDNYMRFGRSATEPSDKSANFMRFGKSDQNFMRFGKSGKNSTEVQEQKNQVKQMMLADHEKDSGESNPMDKAIKVLYHNKQKDSTEVDAKNHEGEATDADYVFNMLDQ